MKNLWKGLRENARANLTQRDYSVAKSFAQRLATTGMEAGDLVAVDRSNPEIAAAWIPGVEVFARKVYPQRHRGFFGELVRQDEGPLNSIGLWPKQWATARMFASTAKGFHIHPPYVPEDEEPENWFRRLFIEEPTNYALRPYTREQWDVMFFLQGAGEMFFVDDRAGMERRKMRLIIEGDDHRGPNNVGVVIPPGVGHAIRAEGSSDAIMVYGTSSQFDPAYEGRIASDVESAPIPVEWQRYIDGTPA